MPEQDGIDPRHDPIYQRGYDPTVHGGQGSSQAPSTRRSRARRDVDLDLYAPPGSRTRATSRDRVPLEDALGTDPGAAGAETFSLWGDDPASGVRDGVEPPAERPSVEAVPHASRDPLVFLTPSPTPSAASSPDRPGSPGDARPSTPPATIAPWRNPYLVGLVVGGAVLALVGFQMFRAALDTIYVDFAQSGFLFGGGGSTPDEEPDPTGELVAMQLGWSIGPLLLLIGLTAILAAVVFVAVRWRPRPETHEGASASASGSGSDAGTGAGGARR